VSCSSSRPDGERDRTLLAKRYQRPRRSLSAPEAVTPAVIQAEASQHIDAFKSWLGR